MTVLPYNFIIGLGNNLIQDRCFEEDPNKAIMDKIVKLALLKEASVKDKCGQEVTLISMKTEPVHFRGHRQYAGRKQSSARPSSSSDAGPSSSETYHRTKWSGNMC